MKIAGLSIWYIIAAIGIGLIISFGLSFFQTPQPVDVHKIEITPVPTPAPVYIQPTIQPIIQPTQPGSAAQLAETWSSNGDGIVSFLALGLFVLAATFVIGIVASVLVHQ
jgi:hypothetical protein